mmetsp:Transcript_42493/g.128947  ORF Transcript_42493/g.128947 Transcript_42493/m.128947 type:complete len:120 (-) Transcript_42493:43-402(-)
MAHLRRIQGRYDVRAVATQKGDLVAREDQWDGPLDGTFDAGPFDFGGGGVVPAKDSIRKDRRQSGPLFFDCATRFPAFPALCVLSPLSDPFGSGGHGLERDSRGDPSFPRGSPENLLSA